jgi:AcrR family transcriptional regulator
MPRKSSRRHQQGIESRQRILDAALTIAAERGYDGTTIALVTKETGLPASSVYWHFKNKDQLLAETLDYSYRKWRAGTPTWSGGVDRDDAAGAVRERLQRAAQAIVESPEFWRLGLMLALENRPVEPLARTRYLQVREETRAAIEAWWRELLVTEGLPAGSDVPQRVARFHLAFMDGLFLGLRSRAGWDRERIVDIVAAGVYRQAQLWIAEEAV